MHYLHGKNIPRRYLPEIYRNAFATEKLIAAFALRFCMGLNRIARSPERDVILLYFRNSIYSPELSQETIIDAVLNRDAA